ncbi:MAG: hypothetical protein WCH65_08400 [bacterium]
MKTQLLFMILLILGISSISAQTDSNTIIIENLTVEINKLDSQICKLNEQKGVLMSQKNALEKEETNKNLKTNEATISITHYTGYSSVTVCFNDNIPYITVVVSTMEKKEIKRINVKKNEPFVVVYSPTSYIEIHLFTPERKEIEDIKIYQYCE